MLILGDILAAPFKGILWTFEKIHQAAMEELERQRNTIRTDLRDLYGELDAGRISEDEFDTRERELLDRLDRLNQSSGPDAAAPGDEPPEDG